MERIDAETGVLGCFLGRLRLVEEETQEIVAWDGDWYLILQGLVVHFAEGEQSFGIEDQHAYCPFWPS